MANTVTINLNYNHRIALWYRYTVNEQLHNTILIFKPVCDRSYKCCHHACLWYFICLHLMLRSTYIYTKIIFNLIHTEHMFTIYLLSYTLQVFFENAEKLKTWWLKTVFTDFKKEHIYSTYKFYVLHIQFDTIYRFFS